MRRNLAVLCIVLGTAMFGIAAGFVYLDQRDIQIRYLLAKGGQAPGPDDLAVLEANRRAFIAKAMVIGPPGAGLMLAGIAIVILELPWFRRSA